MEKELTDESAPDEHRKFGLAGLAGGWEGSEELADILKASLRSDPRDVPGLD